MSLQATETGAMLRCALGLTESRINAVRSHSLKVTCLSWLAKFGIPLEYRRSLGHHLDVSAECYSRDAMAPAMRKPCEVVKAIEKGSFFPDSTRSGRFKKTIPTDAPGGHHSQPAPRPLEDRRPDVVGVDDSEVSSVGIAGDSTDSDVSSDAEIPGDSGLPDTEALTRLTTEDMRPKMIAVRSDSIMWRHSDSGKQHLQIVG